MFDVTKANQELRETFDKLRDRFPSYPPEMLWATAKATVAAGTVLASLTAERRLTDPTYTPSPELVAQAFGLAAKKYMPEAETAG